MAATATPPTRWIAHLGLILLMVLFLISAAGRAHAQFDAPALTRTLEAARTETSTVGFAVGVISDGKIVYAKGLGVHALGKSTPVTTRSNFHWASVSKPFVATAIMQLVEGGRLSLNAKLTEILPDYAVTDPRQHDITVRQILMHTAGIPDVEEYGWDKPEYDDDALARWVTKDSPRELLFDPGTRREYSNVGFEILGLIIERVSGLSFSAYMHANIFQPLNMSDSTFFFPRIHADRRTAGHIGNEDVRKLAPHYPYNRRHGPSSTLNSSIEDMALFTMALLNPAADDISRILTADTIGEMWSPAWTIEDEPLQSATLGWVWQDYQGTSMVRHFGSDDGYRSALIILPEMKSAILFVTNDEEAPQRDIILGALAALMDSRAAPAE